MNELNDIETCTHSIQLQCFEIKQECVICFELFTEQYKLPCNHTFCDMCIIQWLFQCQQNSCPICKNNVFKTHNEKQHFYLIHVDYAFGDDNDTPTSYKIMCALISAVSIVMTFYSIYLISLM